MKVAQRQTPTANLSTVAFTETVDFQTTLVVSSVYKRQIDPLSLFNTERSKLMKVIKGLFFSFPFWLNDEIS